MPYKRPALKSLIGLEVAALTINHTAPASKEIVVTKNKMAEKLSTTSFHPNSL